MKVLYVAKHGSGGNDDEGSIAFALEQLGHEVVKVQEYRDIPVHRASARYDLCLFHKWCEPAILGRMECPKAFWYFDLVDWPSDPSLRGRCEARKKWMTDVVPLVDAGFCTDGDHVANDESGKLVTLRQGADERIVGFGREQPRDVDVLFVGISKGGGAQRESFVHGLMDRYGERCLVVHRGVYREALRDLVARAKVVVCPDSPVTDRYWSNRIYTMAGFGACLLHPRVDHKIIPGVFTYKTRLEMFGHIDDLLVETAEYRGRASSNALDVVKHGHLYRHRCEEMLRVLKERNVTK